MSTQLKPQYSNLGFDPDALREKYRQERDKRVRPEGNDQYVEVTGKFAHFVDDPYVEPGFTREPLTDEVDIVIIGGGFGGLLAGARFRQAGLDQLPHHRSGRRLRRHLVLESLSRRAVRHRSRTATCRCSKSSATCRKRSIRSRRRSTNTRSASRTTFDLYDARVFPDQGDDLRWDEDLARWIVTTDRDDAMKARFVVMATGPLNRPKLPSVPGIEEFEGHTFHTSRWDYDYTGGDHSGGLTKLADKRVAIIGTGATAIQSVPHVGAHAKHLYVFQRTPSSVDLRGNKPTDPNWAKTLKPGWQRERRENFNAMVTGQPMEEDLVNDGWTEIFRTLASMIPKQERGADLAGGSRAAGRTRRLQEDERHPRARRRRP